MGVQEEGPVETRRLMAVVQYDGTSFAGFQRQKDQRTVQAALEAALAELLGHPVTVRGAGRTDAGVHARGQVISFTTTSAIPADKVARAIAGFLPDDVILESAKDAALDFDPLRDAAGKTYCYRIWRLERPDVLWDRYSYRYPWTLDLDLMQAEASRLSGKHDFASFRALGSSVTSTVREVGEARFARADAGQAKDALLEFRISADGFLYKMVRLCVGTLLDVGRGHLPPGTVVEALQKPGQVRIGQCVPGKGLCLEEVSFS